MLVAAALEALPKSVDMIIDRCAWEQGERKPVGGSFFYVFAL